jgi:RimJ/RimL family protein N-acetyltransferase
MEVVAGWYREYLWFVFYFPFIQLGVTKIIAPVESGNLACRRFIEHIGFILEATLKDCAPKGDLLIYTMRKDQCKWLGLKGHNVQTTRHPAT